MVTHAQPSVGVIGAGRWGSLHAQKLSALPGVRLAAIIDSDLDRAQRLGDRLGVPGVARLEAAPPLDAVTIATPLPSLAPVVAQALEQGLHVLAEKPLALTVTAAEALVAQAEAAGLHLRVGYLERFNPAIRPVVGAARMHRLGPTPPEALLLDWMVHDLDLALWLTDAAPVVEAVERGAQQLSVRLGGGPSITIHAGFAPQISRGLVDAQGAVNLGGAGDPLAAQLAEFVGLLNGRPAPRLADGHAAVRVLRLVAAIEQRLRGLG